MSWTDERVETLKAMWSEGKSASQIAKELGGVTRNAVIGKVHRLGLSNRSGPEAEAPQAAAEPAPKAARPAETPSAPPEPKQTPAQRPASPCRRSLRPTKSAKRPWPISPRSPRRPRS